MRAPRETMFKESNYTKQSSNDHIIKMEKYIFNKFGLGEPNFQTH